LHKPLELVFPFCDWFMGRAGSAFRRGCFARREPDDWFGNATGLGWILADAHLAPPSRARDPQRGGRAAADAALLWDVPSARAHLVGGRVSGATPGPEISGPGRAGSFGGVGSDSAADGDDVSFFGDF